MHARACLHLPEQIGVHAADPQALHAPLQPQPNKLSGGMNPMRWHETASITAAECAAFDP